MLIVGIYDWLNQHNIKYEYATEWSVLGRRVWYFKNEEDATAFVLRWS
jgi:hypothetical protein